jgi:phosphopantothenoylcysteine synthetase/decarboxylase
VSGDRRWLYLVVAAAPPALRIAEFVTALQAAGWNVAVIATPAAAGWIELDALAAETGCTTHVHTREPRAQEPLPRATAVVAAPMTFNSINKWAAGTSDNLALGILNEMLGTGVPIVAVPCVKAVLRKHPAYEESIGRLTRAGISMMDPDAVTRRADDGLATFAWPQILATLNERLLPETDA